MPEMITDSVSKGFDVLNKVVDKTSHKYKAFNLVPLSIGILAVIIIIVVGALSGKIDNSVLITLSIVLVVILLIVAASISFQDYLNMKRLQINQYAYNQQYENRD